MLNHRFRVTAITHRCGADLADDGAPARREDVNLLGLEPGDRDREAVERDGAELVDLRLGPTILGCTIAIRQRYPGEARTSGSPRSARTLAQIVHRR